MQQAKKLIEVAMPIKEISAESLRDKSIRHGHISTLHLWWARRPLPVCRAVVFASLVPDPLDENCAEAFKDAVRLLLHKQPDGTDPYKPYNDIPYTSAIDRMDDTLRNRLLMFVGKFSPKFCQNERLGKSTPSKDKLDERSLVKWDNRNNDAILSIARKLIWVAYNAASEKSVEELLAEFSHHSERIREAEDSLYNTLDRHLPNNLSQTKEKELNDAISDFLERMPKVFDPFAGGGAIPLEAARLGCRSYGNDINPVAHIIQKGSVEYPQRFGKPITYSKEAFIKAYGTERWNDLPNETLVYTDGIAASVNVRNRLVYDVEFYAGLLQKKAEAATGDFYPTDSNNSTPIAYYWAKVGTCSNPSCGAEVPLLRQFYLAKTKNKSVYLNPIIKGSQIEFEIKQGRYAEAALGRWNNRGNLVCPCCQSVTDVNTIKKESINRGLKEKLIAVIEDSTSGKKYRIPTKSERLVTEKLPIAERTSEKMQRNSAGGDTFSWGISEWTTMFSNRQLLTMHSLVEQFQLLKEDMDIQQPEYKRAVITYLGILIDKVAMNSTSFGLWKPSGEFLSGPFGRQAIPMVFDYPESYIFCGSTGGLTNQLDWIVRYIESECKNSFPAECKHASSGDKSQFPDKYLTACIPGPPYYDAIAYADLSDFFYVWLKRTLGNVYPMNFATPQTPKTEECTALKHHHSGNRELAMKHFEDKLTQIFDAIEHQTSGLVSIMFAHQSTEAWTTLCNSILGAKMNISSSWPMDSEREVRTLALAGAALESSVTVSARPSTAEGVADYREVRLAIKERVSKEVEALYHLGFRGADLLTACFGKAVSEFGKYERVEKADGALVTVAELLEMAKESAFNALLKGFEGDECTKFYIGWLQLYGFRQSDFDDAAKFSRVGLSINVQELFNVNILIKEGNKQTLGGFQERLSENHNIGGKLGSNLIDQVHKAMSLYKTGNRVELLVYLKKVASSPEGSFWRVVTSLCEVLPAGTEDLNQASGLLANKESLLRDAKQTPSQTNQQVNITFEE